MSPASFLRQYRVALVLTVSVVVCLGTAWAVAQEAPSRSFPDSPYLRIDPEKIQGAEVCGECHAEEAEVWKQTTHQTQFATLHQSEKAQGILDRMGFRLAKRESLCLRCHYTATVRRDQARASTGVSCESCHGAGRDWIDIHNDYGGATRDDESAVHKTERIQSSIESGMLRPTGDIYAVAANCFECHTVPDERLINEGGHPSGSPIELVSWSDSIRHNFLEAQWSSNRSNREQSDARKRLMFVVGQVLDYEYSLRGLANASSRSPYSKAMERRAKVAYRALKNTYEAVALNEIKEILDLGDAVTLGPDNAQELLDVADQVAPAVRRMSDGHDWDGLPELDPLMAGTESVADAVVEIDPTDADTPTTTVESPGTGSTDPEASPDSPVASGVQIEGQIRARPDWFITDKFQTTVPGCSCHTNAEDWLLDDPHSQSLDLMNSPRAVQIAQIYGIRPDDRLLGNQMCMSCHGTVISGDEREEVFDPVSCESCHGASSGYLDPHERGDGVGFTFGQKNLKDASTRATNCSRCHYITDDRLLAAGHPNGNEYDLAEASQAIKHWPDDKNVERSGPYPEVAGPTLSTALSAIKSNRPLPAVTVVEVAPASVAPSVSSGGAAPGTRTTSGNFQSPHTRRTTRSVAPGSLQLPPMPQIDESISTEELLLLIKQRLELIYQALGRGN